MENREVIYTKGVFLVLENTLTDGSKTHDVHVWVDGYLSSMELFQALSKEDGIARADLLNASLQERPTAAMRTILEKEDVALRAARLADSLENVIVGEYGRKARDDNPAWIKAGRALLAEVRS